MGLPLEWWCGPNSPHVSHLEPVMVAFLMLALPAAFAGKLSPSVVDSDGDGVYDNADVCQGEDDTVDLDANGVQDCVETFFSDFGFDSASSLTWLNLGGVTDWMAGDANGYAGSGSLRHHKYSGDPEDYLRSECMAVTPNTPHVLMAQYKLTSSSGSPQVLFQLLRFETLADCNSSGWSGELTVNDVVPGQELDWTTYETRFTTGGDTAYMRLIVRPRANSTTYLYLDNFLLHDDLDLDDEEIIDGMD